MSTAYDPIEIRVPVRADHPTYAKNVIVRDRPSGLARLDGLDRQVYVGVGSAHTARLYLAPEEAEAVHEALSRWKERRAALRCAERAEERS